jgi:hypothetical protein
VAVVGFEASGLGLELLHIERAARHMPLGRRQMTLNISSSSSSLLGRCLLSNPGDSENKDLSA